MVNDTTGHKPQQCKQSIGDAELPYLLYEGDGPPLILLHATGFQPWLWHPIARTLARDYRIFAPDFCNHRESDPEKGGLGWTILAEDIVRFCRALNLKKPFLVGHSMGGTILMIAHALNGLPASGMVLIEPILLPPEIYRTRIRVDQHPFAAKAIKRTNFWRDEREAMAYLHSRALFREWDAEMLELYVRHGMAAGEEGLQLACSPRREASLFMGGIQYDPWPLLAKVSCPVCLLEGQKSENGAFIDFDKIQSLISDCRRHVVKEAGHLIPMERPGEVSRLIGEFFDPLRSRREKEAA